MAYFYNDNITDMWEVNKLCWPGAGIPRSKTSVRLQFVHLSLYLSIYLSIYLYIYIYIYLSVVNVYRLILNTIVVCKSYTLFNVFGLSSHCVHLLISRASPFGAVLRHLAVMSSCLHPLPAATLCHSSSFAFVKIVVRMKNDWFSKRSARSLYLH